MKLGKLPPKKDARTLRLASYLRKTLPLAPLEQHWEFGIQNWGMMLNDQLGDCTCASAGHMIRTWSANIGKEILVSDQEIQEAYEAVSGYDPQTGLNDNGAYELDVLNYWRKNGIGGQSIYAYAALDTSNWNYIKWAIMLFGGVYVGLALPNSAQNQDIWQAENGPSGEPGSWGGHAVPLVGYDMMYIECVTWGTVKRMTWDFWAKYGDEAYAVLSPNWVDRNNLDPNLISFDVLEEDLKVITA